ncbi:predicted protein [Naegleria gruberi]|uniref:Predicted protein n=1 Tax=Naegleria gruberi TaxID=5762 RepID=D2VWB7_NAEGR|nr:uncharacterized protein NAEGRDRAFT_73325 [Naegleria gruberi]EFC38871.1 predicted protein [Naegleria gruberi]|eukprot:XP_002671615.1 predicted protein [Naegleria gruberi strain NEG-M]
MNSFPSLTDPYFGELECDPIVWKKLIKKETIIVAPMWDEFSTIRYIFVHYLNEVQHVVMLNGVDLEKLIEKCKEIFNDQSLEYLIEPLGSRIESIDQLQHLSHYTVLKKMEENKEKQLDIISLRELKECVNSESEYLKTIPMDHSYNFEEIYKKLLTHKKQYLVKVLRAGHAFSDDGSEMKFVLMERCEADFSKYLEKNKISNITDFLNKVELICLCVKDLHSLNIVHMDTKSDNLLSKFVNEIFTLLFCDFEESIDVSDMEIFNDKVIISLPTTGTDFVNSPESYYCKYNFGNRIIHTNFMFRMDSWSVGINILLLILKFLLNYNGSEELVMKRMKCFHENTNQEYEKLIGFGEWVAAHDSHEAIHSFINEVIDELVHKYPELSDRQTTMLQETLCGLLHKDPSKRMSIDKLLENWKFINHDGHYMEDVD